MSVKFTGTFSNVIVNIIRMTSVGFFCGSHATSANILTGSNSVDLDLNLMNVGVECALCPSVGMADVVAAHATLTANNANSTHNNTSKENCFKSITQNATEMQLKKGSYPKKLKKFLFFGLYVVKILAIIF